MLVLVLSSTLPALTYYSLVSTLLTLLENGLQTPYNLHPLLVFFFYLKRVQMHTVAFSETIWIPDTAPERGIPWYVSETVSGH